MDKQIELNNMKRILRVALSVLVLASLMISCHKDPRLDSFDIEIEKLEVGTSSVFIIGTYEFVGTGSISSIEASFAQQEDFADARNVEVDLSANQFTVSASGLESGTLYYYRFIVDYGGKTDYYTSASTFSTLEFGVPMVITAPVSYVGPHDAVCGGNVTDDGGSEVVARGVCYGVEPEPDLTDFYTLDSCGMGVFVSEMVNLNIGTHYYVRAYATNENGTGYGEQYEFTTMAQSPMVATREVVASGEDAVIVKAEVLIDGGNAVTERGVCWSTNELPTLDDNFIDDGTGTGTYSCTITGLEPNTTYYFRAFARNDVGLGFGEVLSFTTSAPIEKPTVTTVEVMDITAISAKCVGNVSDNGGAEVTDRGACWSKNPNPSLSNSHASSGTGVGSFTVDLTGLSANTIYYVCAYATNSQGTSYGEVFSLLTAEGLPILSTASVTNITGTTATGGGEITNQGASAVTERGVCWSTDYNPVITDAHASSGSGMGSFTVQMTGLTPNQIYFVRAYAINGQGIAYGNEVGFVALDGLSEVLTTGVFDVTANSARVSGNVTNQGASAVTEHGVCWSTEHNPTTDNSHVNNGMGQGNFTCELTGLTEGTVYYARAYSINDQGTSYGEEVNFTTLANKPEVITSQVTNITQTSATGGGNVTSSGGATVTERGVCWSTSHNPTLNDSHASGGSGTGGFVVPITGLQAGTVYYVRAYATNAQGTSYGNEVSFTTTASSPTVTTAQVSNVSQTTAMGGGNVTSDGGAPVTERGICWDTSHNPTVNGSHASNGSGTGAFTVEMAGLTPNTTYYVRAYAINSSGTSYGNEVSFTTSQNISAPSVMTAQVINIMQTTALGGGIVTSSGGADVTERGVCWSTSHAPTVNGSHASSGSGTGGYTVQMTGLTANTTYYVRAYAINSAGTSYGNELHFTTAPDSPTVFTVQVSNIQQNSAIGGGNVTNDGGATVTERGICWGTGHNPTIYGSHANNGTGTGGYVVVMTGLTANTTYYVRAYAINSAGTSYGSEVSFTTAQNISAPTVTTTQVTNVEQTTATGGGNVTDDGGGTVTERGICWSTDHNPTTSDSHGSSGTGLGSFTVNMTELVPSTTYYVRAYAVNSAGTSYGSEVSFTTTEYLFAPTVTTAQVTNITQTTALGGGNVTNDGGADVTERGVCWSTSHNPTTSGNHASNGTGTGSYTVNITGLTASTTYYVRAYAINSQGTSYGEEKSFITTQNISAPTVTTYNVINISQNTATGSGNVTADGGANVTERGVCWSTSQNPTVDDNHANNGTGTGNFVVQMTGLTANTTYYVRAYAVNSAGTSYGNQVSFTTSPNLPTVTTSAVSDITQTTATGGGNVTSDGGATVTERGICWSTSHNPTVSGNHASSGSGTGSFTVSMTGLTPNTTYYVRAYAVNSAGTNYGTEVSFTTSQNVFAPTVTTSSVTNITQTTALGGGNVTDDGGANVTERGVCWSTNHNPTVSNSHASNGTGTGSYTVYITGLSANTTYYVRAYAINSAGTSYGEEVSFITTQTISAPVVTTSSVTNISQTTATGGGNVISDGGTTVTERGICWSTSHNPTTSGTHATSGTGIGSFSVQMTGLTPNTTYYVCAYAINSEGTSYGDEVSFITLQNVSAPTVTTSNVSNITQTSAIGGGNVTSDGGATVFERGICWSTSHDPTTSGSHGSNGTGMGSFTVSMSGLTENTTYYVRAYAINSVGTSYGDEVSFTTLSGGGSNAPVGAIDGVFSVSASQQVYFSKGNLQFQASTNTWRFAENQYDIIGLDNNYISQTYSGWIDLFGWGTSGYNHGATCYQPWSTSIEESHYNAYGNPDYNLFDQTGQADWGYNAISNGGGQTNQWRTLTKEEWYYVFNLRNTSSGIRFVKATVNDVRGVILLPDDWSSSTYALNSTNIPTVTYAANVISASDWNNVLQNAGAVFLPAAGSRLDKTVSGYSTPSNQYARGYYWSSTHDDSYGAFVVHFFRSDIYSSHNHYRYVGLSVRVVCAAE